MDYLDDLFLVGDNFKEFLKAVEDYTDLLSTLGVQIKLQKSVFYIYTKKLVFRMYFRL